VFSYAGGNHSLKFGGDIQRIKSIFIDLEDASGTWDFDSAGDFLANSPSRFRQNFLQLRPSGILTSEFLLRMSGGSNRISQSVMACATKTKASFMT
jgi:hypothetical protein